jgi:2'-5' RNA ligase
VASIRTFIAVDLSPGVRAKAAQLIRKLSFFDDDVQINWVEPQNMHITLKFLGDVPDYDVPQAIRQVQAAAEGFGEFTIRCGGAGAFPSIDKPRTVWLGLTEGADELEELKDRLDDSLAKMRFPRENRRFAPHVTLGRIRRGGPALAELTKRLRDNEDAPGGESAVDELVVYSSELTKQGPVYVPMSRVPL